MAAAKDTSEWKPPFGPTGEPLRACNAVDGNWLCVRGRPGETIIHNGPKEGDRPVNSFFGMALMCFPLPEGSRRADGFVSLYNPDHVFDIEPTRPALYITYQGWSGCVKEVSETGFEITDREAVIKGTRDQLRTLSFADLCNELVIAHKHGGLAVIRYLSISYEEWLRETQSAVPAQDNGT